MYHRLMCDFTYDKEMVACNDKMQPSETVVKYLDDFSNLRFHFEFKQKAPAVNMKGEYYRLPYATRLTMKYFSCRLSL